MVILSKARSLVNFLHAYEEAQYNMRNALEFLLTGRIISIGFGIHKSFNYGWKL
jgi:hypothetical protein